MKKLVVILLLLSGIITTASAQNLSTLSEKERTEKLVKEAKTAIKKYAPDYFRYTDGRYVIYFFDKDDSGGLDESLYRIEFKDYDRTEEYFSQGFAVGVDFREKDGSVESVVNGHGDGIIIPKNKTRGQDVKKLEYKKQPSRKQNTGRTQTFS